MSQKIPPPGRAVTGILLAAIDDAWDRADDLIGALRVSEYPGVVKAMAATCIEVMVSSLGEERVRAVLAENAFRQAAEDDDDGQETPQ
jgi:hypothetical protein